MYTPFIDAEKKDALLREKVKKQEKKVLYYRNNIKSIHNNNNNNNDDEEDEDDYELNNINHLEKEEEEERYNKRRYNSYRLENNLSSSHNKVNIEYLQQLKKNLQNKLENCSKSILEKKLLLKILDENKK